MKAYINVFDKENIENVAKELQSKGYSITSSCDTYEYLVQHEIKVEKKTFKEVLDEKFDIYVINFYPFRKYANSEIDTETIYSNMEEKRTIIIKKAIADDSLIITRKEDYSVKLDELIEDKNKLKLIALDEITKFNSFLLEKLSLEYSTKEEFKTFSFNKIKQLRYGENPHQKAGLYSFESEVDYKILNGRELSYNDVLNSTTALEIASEFFDVSAVVIVKYSTPCEVALSSDINSAFDRALDADPLSPFNAVCAFTKEVDLKLARKLKALNEEVIIAPSYTSEALAELKKDIDLRIIQINTPLEEILKFNREEIEITPFGALIQEKDKKELTPETFKVVTKKKPEQKHVEDMIFAFKVAKHVKSSAVVVAKDLRTIGIAGGQFNRNLSVAQALDRVCDSPKDSVVASDGAINEINAIEIMAQNRVSGVIQPMGAKNDKEIIEKADKFDISMISTGIRHFKH